MAIYHCNITVASRADGASAVAGAAYISRSRIECERDGLVHDYTRAHMHERLVADLGVALPEPAPGRWSDRAVLWNEVERVERKSDAQLARRIECALPDELPEAEQIVLARAIVADRVADGHVVDACVHRGANGRNTHLHMLEPLRRCDADGFMAKSENVYTVRRPLAEEVWSDATGEAEREREAERANERANGARFGELKGCGYEKVYKYRRGNEWRHLTPTEAGYEENAGFERQGKTPVQETRYLNAGWNDRARAEEWREAVARRTNEALERAGLPARVDHRSYERQGVDKAPQLHEGSRVSAIERRERERAAALGAEYRPVSDRARENAERRRLNAELARATERLRAAMSAFVSGLDGTDRARVSLARSWRRPALAFAGRTRAVLSAASRRRAERRAHAALTARRGAPAQRRAAEVPVGDREDGRAPEDEKKQSPKPRPSAPQRSTDDHPEPAMERPRSGGEVTATPRRYRQASVEDLLGELTGGSRELERRGGGPTGPRGRDYDDRE